MISKILSVILLFSIEISGARPPPENCDAGSIQDCLSSFETKLAECDSDDLHCQCNYIITSGANCYAACPQDAMTTFIKTYNEGRCATFDPYISRRDSNSSEPHNDAEENAANHKEEQRVLNYWLGLVTGGTAGRSESSKQKDKNLNVNQGDVIEAIHASKINGTTLNDTKKANQGKIESAVARAITVTADYPTTTISLSPQEYQSRLEKSRYKENLRSIRSERARSSSEAEARLAVAHAALETVSSESIPPVPKALAIQSFHQTVEARRKHQRKHKSGASGTEVSLVLLVAALVIAIC